MTQEQCFLDQASVFKVILNLSKPLLALNLDFPSQKVKKRKNSCLIITIKVFLLWSQLFYL